MCCLPYYPPDQIPGITKKNTTRIFFNPSSGLVELLIKLANARPGDWIEGVGFLQTWQECKFVWHFAEKILEYLAVRQKP